jgi:potassium-dependent mechanosensitive channel
MQWRADRCSHSAAMFGWESSRLARIAAGREPEGKHALHRLGALLLALLALIGLAGFASAQTQDTPRQRLDAVRAALVEIDAAFTSPNLSDGDLQRLRAENDPLATEAQSIITELAPKLEASVKRLAELTPKSKDKASEADAAAAELTAEQNIHDDLDADLRSARALALQIDDNSARIGAARRALFARQTFARSSSILSPLLWASVIHEAPADIATLGGLLYDWLSGVASRLTRQQALGLLCLALAFGAVAVPIRWVARRVIARDPAAASPSKLRRAFAAIWTALVLGGIPLLGLVGVSYALDAFDLSDPRLQGLQDAALDGLKLLFIANALARGLLAPGRRSWRLIAMNDQTVARVFRLWMSVAAIVAIEKAIETVADIVAASLSMSVAARGVGAALVVALIARLLRTTAVPAASPETPPRDGGAPGRTLVWLLGVVLLGATLVGYIAFATFVIAQMIWVAGIGTTIYLISVVVDEGTETILQPSGAFGRRLMSVAGLGREALEQIAVLIEGAARVALLVTGILLVLAPWGIQSQDMFGSLRAAYFGFRLGNVTISVSSMLAAASVFVVGVLITRAVQSWLASRLLPRTRLDSGVRNSIKTIFGYVGFVFALVLGSAQLGLNFQNLAIIAGALGVGIGFGLQSIVNNFLSGLILLWERGIRVGDWVVIGAEQGFVRRISARATEVETFDRATLIVPNATLVSGVVKNWVHSDRVGRIIIGLNVAYDNDADAVREILIAVAKAQELVLSIPAPLVLFNEFADWALKFQLICFVDDIEMADRVKSEMLFDLLRRLKKAGVHIAYPYPTPAAPAKVEDAPPPGSGGV